MTMLSTFKNKNQHVHPFYSGDLFRTLATTLATEYEPYRHNKFHLYKKEYVATTYATT